VKILVVCDEWPWPPHQGDRVRLEAMVRMLSARHHVTVLGRPSDLGPPDSPQLMALNLDISKNRVGLVKHPGLPAAVGLRVSKDAQGQVTTAAKSHDRVLFYQLKTTAWLARPLAPSKVVIDLTDSLGLYYARRGGALWMVESARAFRWERDLAEKYPVTVSSEHDRKAIDPTGRRRVTVAPNGYWVPSDVERRPEPDTLIAVGHWSYYPNRTGLLHFLKEIWPMVKKMRSEARLWIVGRGKNPMPRPVSGVDWVGEVDDLGEWYRRAWLAIAPVYVGAGMKTKIMEALFYGVPVVATTFATEGIEPNSLLVAAVGDQDLARKILGALNANLRWGVEDRAQFLLRNTWSQTLLPLLNLVEGGDVR